MYIDQSDRAQDANLKKKKTQTEYFFIEVVNTWYTIHD